MSLLMDALKKAELAKRKGQGDDLDAQIEIASPDGLALEPIPLSSAAESIADSANTEGEQSNGAPLQLPAHLAELEEKFLAEATQAATNRIRTQAPAVPSQKKLKTDRASAKESFPREPSTVEARSRQPADTATPPNKAAAQNLFTAKHAEKPPSRKAFVITVSTLTILAAGGIGGYFWWQLQPKSSLIASTTGVAPPLAISRPIAPPPPAVAQPVAQIAAAPVAPATPATPAAIPAPPEATGSQPMSMDRDATDEEIKNAAIPAEAKAVPRARRAAPAPEEPFEASDPIRITRSPLKVDPALMRGYDAFNRGELAMAQLEYERAQKSDPRNTDVLHGLAAIAVRQGNAERADQLFQEIAELNPQDTVAISALINSRSRIDPSAAESRLKSLSASQPDLAAPHFSLGNLYAQHGRWGDAQQAYFRAYSAEPENPDILYNLAVSFEHLRKNTLAAQYYSLALSAAQSRPGGFDTTLASARLRALRP